MVGREAELAMLLEAFGRAEAGEAQVAVVTGEAGILLEYDERAGVAGPRPSVDDGRVARRPASRGRDPEPGAAGTAQAAGS